MHRHGHHHHRGHRSLEAAGAAGLTAAIVVASSGMMEGEGWRGGRGPGRGRGPFGPGGPRRGGRARRGDVRAAILALLGETPMHGYQIIQELETRSNGLWRPSPGSVYPTLQLFVDEGLVTRLRRRRQARLRADRRGPRAPRRRRPCGRQPLGRRRPRDARGAAEPARGDPLADGSDPPGRARRLAEAVRARARGAHRGTPQAVRDPRRGREGDRR